MLTAGWAGFVKGLLVVVVVAVAGYLSDVASLTALVGPMWASIVAAVAGAVVSALESSSKAKSGGKTALFGAVKLEVGARGETAPTPSLHRNDGG